MASAKPVDLDAPAFTLDSAFVRARALTVSTRTDAPVETGLSLITSPEASTTSSSSVASATRGAGKVTTSVPSASPIETFRVLPPTTITSPEASVIGSLISSPLSRVPASLPRSSTVSSPFLPIFSRKWTADTLGSMSWMVADGPLPTMALSWLNRTSLDSPSGPVTRSWIFGIFEAEAMRGSLREGGDFG